MTNETTEDAKLERSTSKRTLTAVVNSNGRVEEYSSDSISVGFGFDLTANTLEGFLSSASILAPRPRVREQLLNAFRGNGHEQIEYHGDFGNEHYHFTLKPVSGGRVLLTIVDDSALTSKYRHAELSAEKAFEIAENYITLSRTIGHELKMPVNIIEGFARGMLGDIESGMIVNPKDLIEKLAIIIAESSRAKRNAENVLAITPGKLEKEQIDMYQDVVAPVIHDSYTELMVRNKKIIIDEGSSMKLGNARLIADKNRCRLLYANLTNNAMKHMSDVARVCYGVKDNEDNGHYYEFNVYNSGPVINPGIIDRLFQDGVKEGIEAGAGLGLATGRRIVEEHGGKIWAEKNRKEGANIVFTLPKE